MNNLIQLCIETIDTFTYKQITFIASKDLKKLNIRILKELTGSVNDTELFIDLDEQQLKKKQGDTLGKVRVLNLNIIKN